LEEYRKIAMLLARKPKAPVSAKIQDLENTRSLLVERSQKIADYLNWFEVTQIDEVETPHDQSLRSSAGTQLNNPYSLYLDSLEARGW
jgi:hypothetical protein